MATVTALGRMLLQKTMNYMNKELDIVIIYGDTDSIYWKIEKQNPLIINEQVNQHIKEKIYLFKDKVGCCLSMQLEEVLQQGFFIENKKKKYCGLKISLEQINEMIREYGVIKFTDYGINSDELNRSINEVDKQINIQ